MSREREKNVITWFQLVATAILCLNFTSCSEDFSHYISPTSVRHSPYKPQYSNIQYFKDYRYNQKGPGLITKFQNEKIFQIEPSDAIDVTKYSQPAVDHLRNSSPGLKVPSLSLSNVKISPLLTQNYKTSNSQEQIPIIDNVPKKNTRIIESDTPKTHDLKSSLGGEYKFEDERNSDLQSDMSFREETPNQRPQDKNNFTDADTKFLPVSSDAILNYETPSNIKDEDIVKNKNTFKINTEQYLNVSSHNLEKSFSDSIIPSSILTTLPEPRTETAIILNTYHHIEILNQTDLTDNTLSTTFIPSSQEEANFSSGVPLLDNSGERLSSGTVAGIVIAVLVCVTLLSSAVIYLLYRKYNGKCTSVVESKFNTDNCGYLDDSLRSSIYLNNHIELPKESSEEMSSLDNDSFLNSLETMTIQNYWADNSKNTKV